MNITEDTLFDHRTNIKKFHKKFSNNRSILDSYIKLYDILQNFLSGYDVKLYVGLINIIGAINDLCFSLPLTTNDNLYYTNTNITITIDKNDENNEIFDVVFKINEYIFEKKININDDEHIKSEDSDNFFQKATKCMNPNIIADYLLLCDEQQQKYLLSIVNDDPLEKEKALHTEITNLTQKIINLEYDNVLTNDRENDEMLILKKQLQNQKIKYINACNKIRKLQEPYSTSAYIIGTIVVAHLFLYGVFFVNMADPNIWT